MYRNIDDSQKYLKNESKQSHPAASSTSPYFVHTCCTLCGKRKLPSLQAQARLIGDEWQCMESSFPSIGAQKSPRVVLDSHRDSYSAGSALCLDSERCQLVCWRAHHASRNKNACFIGNRHNWEMSKKGTKNI